MKTFYLFLSFFCSVICTAQETITLVEQFTGFKCPQCPDAMLLMDSLEAEFQDSVVFVNIHTGTFADPNTTGSDFLVDLTISQSDSYYQLCNPIGIPAAMISRRVNPNSSPSLSYLSNDWRNRISDIVSIPKPVDMNISYSYNSAQNELDITVQNELMTNLNGDYNIVYYIIEDNVITDQLMPNATINTTYAHQHVLRDVLNSTWGDSLFSGNTTAGTVIPHTIQYTPSSNIQDLNNCSIIAYIRDVNNNEVIQVTKTQVNGLFVGYVAPESLELQIYPNPVSDYLNVQYTSSAEQLGLKIINQLGKTVHSCDLVITEQNQVDLTHLQAGVYLITITRQNGETLGVKKIIKI